MFFSCVVGVDVYFRVEMRVCDFGGLFSSFRKGLRLEGVRVDPVFTPRVVCLPLYLLVSVWWNGIRMRSWLGDHNIELFYIHYFSLNNQDGPYHSDSTASRLLSEVKHCRVELVLRWGTTLESSMFIFCFLPFVFLFEVCCSRLLLVGVLLWCTPLPLVAVAVAVLLSARFLFVWIAAFVAASWAVAVSLYYYVVVVGYTTR